MHLLCKWIDIDKDGQSIYQECKICGKRRIDMFVFGEHIWRKQWIQKRCKFLNEEKRK